MWKLNRMLMTVLVTLSLSTLSLTGCADTDAKSGLKVEKAGMARVTATVEALDLKTRMVTLKAPDGKSFTIVAGKEVVNLPQVKVGDEVVAVYAHALAVRMAKPGEVRAETTQGVAKAVPGSMPGAMEVIETTVTAKIVGIDKVLETASLVLPDGACESSRWQIQPTLIR